MCPKGWIYSSVPEGARVRKTVECLESLCTYPWTMVRRQTTGGVDVHSRPYLGSPGVPGRPVSRPLRDCNDKRGPRGGWGSSLREEVVGHRRRGPVNTPKWVGSVDSSTRFKSRVIPSPLRHLHHDPRPQTSLPPSDPT